MVTSGHIYPDALVTLLKIEKKIQPAKSQQDELFPQLWVVAGMRCPLLRCFVLPPGWGCSWPHPYIWKGDGGNGCALPCPWLICLGFLPRAGAGTSPCAQQLAQPSQEGEQSAFGIPLRTPILGPAAVQEGLCPCCSIAERQSSALGSTLDNLTPS